MTGEILKNSVAESIRYLRAYGEERIREVEDMWNSLEEDEQSEAPEPHAEPSVTPPSSALPQAATEKPVRPMPPDTDQPSRSFLQRLLGW